MQTWPDIHSCLRVPRPIVSQLKCRLLMASGTRIGRLATLDHPTGRCTLSKRPYPRTNAFGYGIPYRLTSDDETPGQHGEGSWSPEQPGSFAVLNA